MEQEPVMAVQDAENDAVMAAAMGALEEILDRIDCQNALLVSSAAVSNVHLQVPDANQKPPESQCTSEEPNEEAEPQKSNNQKLVSNADDSNPDEALLSVPLPHEGSRWSRLRKQMMGLPDFKEYLKWTEDDSTWSIDEAFASFCLDRVEETLSIAKQTDASTQGKKGTRRKGQPKKYERKQAVPLEDNSKRPARKRRGQDNGLKLTEDDVGLDEDEEDEDLLAMDDNPKDLDYQPLPMIRYPKRRRKSLPRAINNYQAQPKTPSRPKPPAKPTKSPKKTPASKKAAKTPAKTTKLETYSPPRKRGRPRKPATESQKKFPKLKVKAEKPAKTYIRMEVRLQRLPKMYECKTCFEQFPDAEEIKKHFLSVHQRDRLLIPPQNNANENIEGENPNPERSDMDRLLLPDITSLANVLRQCPKCKKYVENMTVHKREHRERNFICEECGKGFTENQILQKHRKVHEMDRTGDRYKCQLCDKSYRFSQNLRSHMLYHGGEKTFICDHCGKSFYTNNRLIIHSAIHMKEKPYKCSECGRGFSQKSNMQKHERVHTGVKPYQCDLCKESFNHKVSLKNHKKKHHGIDWWEEAGRPKPATTRKSKESSQTVVVNTEEPVPIQQEANTVPQEDQLVTENQWKGNDMTIQRDNNVGNQWRDDQQPVREAEPAASPWHQPENNLNLEQQNHAAAEEAVRLQTLHQAGNQWKGNNMPLDRQGQTGEQGMTAFFYPSTYLQGYPSGYPGMPIVPINSDGTVHPATRPSYQ
ncbi:zinc finger protein 37-like [Patiria miniata]|uniref:C2H2-type domain-containing protein n=1 Tax=Patiria miniata TaxID=46514 RepID=A0A914B7W6_PATMI|nr:zinc finger protein 37-like [Patiria miniata]